MTAGGSAFGRATRLERMLFAARWLLAPFFVGLILAIAALLVRFLIELWAMCAGAFDYSTHDMIVGSLTLIDIALIACLMLIIAFSGYEIFVSKLYTADHPDRPPWLDKMGFSDLKAKLLGALVSIAAVELLKGLFNLEQYSNSAMAWKAGALLVFSLAGALFAYTDRIVAGKHDRSGAA
jgi:uncharacterized protein (TIGR00645 family)